MPVRRQLSCRTSPSGRQTIRPRALVEKRIPLPGGVVLSDPARVAIVQLDTEVSASQIAVRPDVSLRAVLEALAAW